MSGLVGYASSDDESDMQPEKPAKIAKTEAHSVDVSKKTADARQAAPQAAKSEQQILSQPESGPEPQGPATGPSAALEDCAVDTPTTTPLSPYTAERQRLRDLTMPTIPNFDIPSSPSPPPSNSEEAAALAATTKKFDRFLELKKQGVHFNERLEKSSSLRNPSLLPKLMEFAGISEAESYISTLSGEVVSWPEDCYVENLVKVSERREKKRLAEREKVDFVPAAAKLKSGGSSAAGTPKGNGGSGSRKSRFDRR